MSFRYGPHIAASWYSRVGMTCFGSRRFGSSRLQKKLPPRFLKVCRRSHKEFATDVLPMPGMPYNHSTLSVLVFGLNVSNAQLMISWRTVVRVPGIHPKSAL